MPRYLIERTTGALTRDDLEAAAKRSIEVIGGLEGVRWVRSYVSDREGKIYCEYDAPDEAAIRRHAELAGLPVDSIVEVALEVSPSMFV